jgi:type I restriction enzyme S subunit
MSKEKLIPELRFPEFIGKDEWKLDNVNSLFDLQDGYPFSSKVFTSNPKNGRQVIRITDINNQNKNSEKVYIPEDKIDDLGISAYSVENGDLLLSLTGAAGFNFYIWGNGAAFINQRTMKITPRDSKNEFLKVILSPLIHEKINGIGTGQNNNLSKDALKAIQFPVPQPQEQQKIASCLSSLDEVIEAHSKKLELLKDHKKGLLQNLFPQEGETVPKVRFPEFEGDGEWDTKTLDELGELVNGLTYSPKDVRNEGLLVLRSSNIQNGIIDFNDCVYVRSDIKGANLSRPKDILICVRNGSKRLIGKNAIIPENIPLATHGAFMTVFRASNPDFVFQLFQSDAYDRQVKADLGATINSINGKNFIKYEFAVPSNPQEQQKIASCLSALDELIIAQQEKIEQLQQHKKGLMQGLFPKIND